MKRFISFCALALLLAGCSNDEAQEPEELQTITFNLSTPLSVTEDPISRAGGDLASKVDKIIYSVWDTNDGDGLITGGEQLPQAANFGKISIKLKAGDYKAFFVAVGKNGKGTFNYIEGSVFTSGSVESFNKEYFKYLSNPLTIGKKSEAKNITLKRGVGCITFNITDKIPEGVAYVKAYFKSDVIGEKVAGGYVTGQDQSFFEAFPTQDGKLGELKAYVFPRTIDKIRILAYDAQDDIILEKSVSNLEIQANKRYTISGTLFENLGSNDFTISIDENWDEEVSVPL